MSITRRVAARFAFKYEPKEKKKSKVDRLMRFIREQTGLSRGLSEEIADAIVRNRDMGALTIQKGWPIEEGVILGPQGDLDLSKVRTQL